MTLTALALHILEAAADCPDIIQTITSTPALIVHRAILAAWRRIGDDTHHE